MADVTEIQAAYSWNLTRISEAFGLSRDTVRKRLREAGVNPTGKRGNAPIYALSDVGPALFAGEGYLTGTDYGPDDLMPKDRKEWFQSENERLKFQQATGELLTVGEYRDDLSETLKKVVSFFETLPDKMERLRTFKPEQLAELEKAGDAFRHELYENIREI